MPENLPEPHTSQAQWDGVTKWSKRTFVNMLGCTVACCAGSLVLCLCEHQSFLTCLGGDQTELPPTHTVLHSGPGRQGHSEQGKTIQEPVWGLGQECK